MPVLSKLSVAAATLLVGATAKGVPELVFYPTIEYWKAGDFAANPLCVNVTAPTFKAENVLNRVYAGLYDFSRKVYQTYFDKVRNSAPADLAYDIKQRSLDSTFNGLVTCGTKQAALQAKRNKQARATSNGALVTAVPDSSYRDGFCGCLEELDASVFCQAMGNFSASTQCLSDYPYKSAAATLGPIVPENDYDWKLPNECNQPISAGISPLDLPLLNYPFRKGTPAEIESSVAMGEGNTYYMAHKAIDHFNRFAEHSYYTAKSAAVKKTGATMADVHTNADMPTELLPGWTSLRLLTSSEPSAKGSTEIPFMAISGNQKDSLLLTVRSPLTTYDARLALYNQQSFKYMYNFTGQIHDGASTWYQATSAVVDIALDSYIQQYSFATLEHPRIILTAEGMPSAGYATVLARHIKNRYANQLPVLEVSVITFGEVYVGDAAFTSDLAQTVNVRNIVLEGDSTNVFPCKKTLTCAQDDLAARTGTATGDVYTYEETPGRVRISLKSMADFDSIWASDEVMYDLAAIRGCGYKCYLAGKFCPSDADMPCSPEQCELMFTHESQ